MKKINKAKQPDSLVRHKANVHSSFDNMPTATKDELRGNLLSEQGHICCYCMKRIPEKIERDGKPTTKMKIEHFKSQENYPTLQLTYSNLFGACTGNEGKPQRIQTCDTKKGNSELTINPILTLPNCESLFKYNFEGEISSINSDNEIDKQLNDILNLNMQTLKEGRSEIYARVQEKIRAESKKFKNDKPGFIRMLKQEKIKWLNRSDNKHKTFCMVAVYYLTKRITANEN